MLAGDAGAAIGQAAAEVSATSAGEASPQATAMLAAQDATDLVIIDGGIENAEALLASVPANASLIMLDSSRSGVQQITEAIASHQNLGSVHLMCHATDGAMAIGNETLSNQNIDTHRDSIAQWGQTMSDGADLVIYGCDLAGGANGAALLNQLASIAGVDIAASNDKTGASDEAAAADWDLEFQIGTIETLGLLAADTLNAFEGQLNIVIYAAGSTGDELMELEINGEIVDTWFVRGTDANSGQFLPYFVDIDGVSVDDIRINFVNDQFDPANGIDRNLRVDRIEVDGVTYETENAAVFSDGTFVDGQGITSGNLQTEFLHGNGFFQFSSAGASNNGNSNIQVSARGTTGQEQFQVLVDGSVVGTFNASQNDQIFSANVEGDVTADRVRVQFFNDLYNPGQNIDRNLEVDFIRINGTTFQTEASSTFSTGTWLPADGVADGFRQSETLHSNGYFQYLAGNNGGGGGNGGGGNAGSFSLVTSEITAVEGQGTVTLEVQRVGGSEGAASIAYFTAGDTAVAGQDFQETSGRLFFADGQTSQTFTVNIQNDSRAESTESFAVRINNPEGADILAPRTSIITLLDDDSGLPRYAGFNSSAGLTLNGSATTTGGQLQLTGTSGQEAGSAFFNTAIPVNANTSFQSTFTFQVGGGSGLNGADGFAFLLQNSSLNALGGNGGFLGYSGIGNSLAVEFDTSQNGGDISVDSVAVVTNGTTANALTQVVSPFNLNNDTLYHAWIEYNGETNTLSVLISETEERPVFAVLKTQLDLSSIVGNQAFAGFSAGNFNRPNYHRIGSWNLTLDVPPNDPPLNPSGNVTEQNLLTGLTQPLAVQFSADGRNIYVAEKAGVIKVARDGNTNTSVVLDISDQVNDLQDRGLVDFVLDPNFTSNGYIYLSYTYDPPEVFDNIGNAFAGPDGTGNRAGRISRFTLDASTGFTTAVAGSELVLVGSNSTWDNFNAFTDSTNNFNEPEGGRVNGEFVRDFINSDSRSHTVGGLAFGVDGNLYASIGDGASFSQTDVRALRVQDLDSLSGKVLRIDPATGQGVSDNPFFDGDPNSNRSKVFQLGLRNPWRLTIDDGTGQLFIGETGLNTFEEINTGGAGANFGWPFYEGNQGVNRPTEGYRDLAQAAAFYANNDATAAEIALQHQGGNNAVVLGDIVNNGDLGLQFEGDVFYNDLFRGVVSHANVGADGSLSDVQVFTTGAEFVVDIQQGVDGSLYYVNLVEGTVGRWQIV